MHCVTKLQNIFDKFQNTRNNEIHKKCLSCQFLNPMSTSFCTASLFVKVLKHSEYLNFFIREIPEFISDGLRFKCKKILCPIKLILDASKFSTSLPRCLKK